jgi:proline dehydrogenase
MSIGRSLLLAAAQSDTLNTLATRSRVVRRATRAFMPGERAEDALEAGAALQADGRGLVFTRLGEALTSLTEAQEVREHYLGFFQSMATRGIRGEVSVKPTQLGLEQSFDRCVEHGLALAEAAHATGSVLWFDMEDSTLVDPTLELYEAVKARWPATGLALQAYLHRTPSDLERLLPLDPVLRLVKGAYAEPTEVAHAAKSDTDAAFEALALRCLEAFRNGPDRTAGPGVAESAVTSSHPRLILGTHDLGLVRRIEAGAGGGVDGQGGAGGKGEEWPGTPRHNFEVHMLYGIRPREQASLVTQGYRVATLISYGEAWYRWYMRRLAERPANVRFVVKSLAG